MVTNLFVFYEAYELHLVYEKGTLEIKNIFPKMNSTI